MCLRHPALPDPRNNLPQAAPGEEVYVVYADVLHPAMVQDIGGVLWLEVHTGANAEGQDVRIRLQQAK